MLYSFYAGVFIQTILYSIQVNNITIKNLFIQKIPNKKIHEFKIIEMKKLLNKLEKYDEWKFF